MAPQHIVVDGSNIATEGRSAPSLKQLEEAVAELKREHPGAEITVIVDATFAHRIDPSELERFETAALAGEYVHPPAGAIGRGDAFLLRVAEKVDATVLSNDSFQEFHGEHPWLFERGRLLGATPVPGIGWIFSPRTPVRGPTSRQAVREAERAKRDVTKAIKVATKEAVAPPTVSGPRPQIGDRRVMRQPAALAAPPHQSISPAAVNDPLTFVSFIAEHPLGAEVTGRVDSYTSHGAVVMVGSTQCYVPLANLAHPPPRSAREVLKRGGDTTFVVRALDPQRRGVELALPGVGTVSGTPSEEMIAAEVRLARKRQPARAPAPKAPRTAKRAGAGSAVVEAATPSARAGESEEAVGAVSTTAPPAGRRARASGRAAKAAPAPASARGTVKRAAATPGAQAPGVKKQVVKKQVVKKEVADSSGEAAPPRVVTRKRTPAMTPSGAAKTASGSKPAKISKAAHAARPAKAAKRTAPSPAKAVAPSAVPGAPRAATSRPGAGAGKSSASSGSPASVAPTAAKIRNATAKTASTVGAGDEAPAGPRKSPRTTKNATRRR